MHNSFSAMYFQARTLGIASSQAIATTPKSEYNLLMARCALDWCFYSLLAVNSHFPLLKILFREDIFSGVPVIGKDL